MTFLETENFFSLTKYRTFKNCRREYYLNYFFSQGGFAENADNPMRQKIHLQKQLLSTTTFKKQLLTQALNDFFEYRSTDDKIDKYIFKILALWQRNMLCGNFINDHKLPILLDFYYQKQPIKVIFETLQQELKIFAKKLTANKFFLDLQKIDKFDFFKIDKNNIAVIELFQHKIYKPILLLFKKNGKYLFIDFKIEPKYEKFYALYNLYFAMNHLKVAPNLVRTVFFDIETVEFEEFDYQKLNISEEINLLTQRISELPADCNFANASIEPILIDKCQNEKICQLCRFAEYCQ